jgi:hypothetical protein
MWIEEPLLVGRDPDEVQNARALPRPDGAVARVLPLEASIARAQGSHDGVRDVVVSIFAAGLPALEEEQGRGVLDHDASNVHWFRNWASVEFFLDLEGQAPEPRHLRDESG